MPISKFSSRFGKNFIWLFLVNNLGYLFSFITLPLLISKFGLQKVGAIFMVQSVILGIAAIANYSFVYYIPAISKKISIDTIYLTFLYNITLYVRSFISIFLGIISVGVVMVLFKDFITLWWFSLSILIPKIINPVLFCNALEKNKYVFKIGFLSKLLFLLFIIFNNNNSLLVNLFLAISELTAILFFLPAILSKNYRFYFLPFQKVKSFFKETFNLFLVNLFSLLKPNATLPLISYFLGNEYVALYTLAEKLMNIIRGIAGSAFNSFFPIYAKEKNISTLFSFKNSVITILISVALVIGVWLVSPYLIFYLNDFKHHKDATRVLQLLAITIPLLFIIIPLFSYVLKLKKWNLILLFAIFQLSVFLISVFMFHKNIKEIAFSTIIAEYVLVLCYIGYYFRNLKKQRQ